MKPYDWQLPAVRKSVQILKEHDLLLNLSGTGTGKTIVSLAAIKELELKTLIVAPKISHTMWRNTADLMGSGDLVQGIVNIERLQHRNPWYSKAQWHIKNVDLVLIDEIHRGASGAKAKTTRIIGELKAYPVKVSCMSATIADNPLKLRAIGFLAGLHKFNNSSFYGWCRQNGCFVSPGIPGLRPPTGKHAIQVMCHIRQALRHLSVRLDPDVVPGFPESSVQATLIDLSPEQTKRVAELYGAAKTTNRLTEYLYARRQTEHAKLVAIEVLVRDAVEEGNSAAVFLNFRQPLFELAERLADLRPALVYGDQKENRDQMLAEFQNNERPVALLTSQAGGFSIDLHDARRERPRRTFLTPSFSAPEMLQCLGRVRRTGGTKSIQTFVLAANTVEEKVYRAIASKMNCIETLNNMDLGKPE